MLAAKKVVVVGVLLSLFSVNSSAGVLDDFEKDATKSHETNRGSSSSDSSNSSSRDDRNSCGSLGDCLLGAIFQAMLEGVATGMVLAGESSMDRMRSYPLDGDLIPRKTGDPLLPIVRLDAYTHLAFGGISANAFRVEAGYGAVAFQLRETAYVESNPSDKMTVKQVHALYRMSVGRGNHVVMGLGLGSFILTGNERHETLSMTFPLQVKIDSSWSWEVKPNVANFNGSSVWDIEGGVLYTKKHIALNLGYRRLSSPEKIIHGPYVGLSFFY